MMGGYYTSLHSENVQKLVLYAPLYNFNDHKSWSWQWSAEQTQADRV